MGAVLGGTSCSALLGQQHQPGRGGEHGDTTGDMGTRSSALLQSNMDGAILGEYTGLLCQEAAGTGTSWTRRDTTDKQVAAGAKIPARAGAVAMG